MKLRLLGKVFFRNRALIVSCIGVHVAVPWFIVINFGCILTWQQPPFQTTIILTLNPHFVYIHVVFHGEIHCSVTIVYYYLTIKIFFSINVFNLENKRIRTQEYKKSSIQNAKNSSFLPSWPTYSLSYKDYPCWTCMFPTTQKQKNKVDALITLGTKCSKIKNKNSMMGQEKSRG